MFVRVKMKYFITFFLKVVIASMRQLVRIQEGKTAKIKDIPGFLTQCIIGKVQDLPNYLAFYLVCANCMRRSGNYRRST